MGRYAATIAPRDANGLLRAESEGANDSGPLSDWRIYTRAASAGDWLSLKLVRMRPGAGRARYWLGWNVATQRLAHTRDAAALPEALRAAIERELCDCAIDGSLASAAQALRDFEARTAALG